MRTTFLLAILLFSTVPVLYAQETNLAAEAEKLLQRVERRPDRAWDYAFALRRLAEADEGSTMVAAFEKGLDHDSEHVQLVCSHLTLHFGNYELAYQTWGELISSEDSAVVESVAMMITAEGPEDEELTERVRMAWEDSKDLSPGARTALCEAMIVNEKDALALEQLREFLSSADHELVGRAALVLSERGHAGEVKGRIGALSREPGDIGRLARIGAEVVTIDEGIEKFRSGEVRRKDKLIEAQIRAITRHYVEDSFVYNDKRQPLDSKHLVENAARAMAGATDRYGAVLTRKEIDEMNQDQEGLYVGIGAHVSVDEDGIIYVTQPIYEGPAYAAGVRSGDKLVGVLDREGKRVDLTKLTLEEGVNLVRGPENSTATIWVRRRGVENELKFEIKRTLVHVDTALEEMLPGQVGYIRLTRFGANSAKDMKQSLENLRRQGMKSLILDLRDNGGGQLSAVLDIADMFLPRGSVISSAGGRHGDWKGTKGPWKSGGGDYNDIPMVCLISGESASGAEMLSGALKDNNRAVVIGRPSFGKGVGQSFYSVDGHAAYVLKCTVFRYFLPSGISIDRHDGVGGVTPNIDVKPRLLEPWQVYAVRELRDSEALLKYLDKHYTGLKKAELMKLATFDGLNPDAWPEFDALYNSLNTKLAKNDVRRELRFALRTRVQDDRGQEFTQNFQEDNGILRGVRELFKKTGQDTKKIPEYKAVMK